jgi:hypothetical protein
MSVDYSNMLRSIVLARGVLLQLMPELTVGSTFAYFISAAPVLIISKDLSEFMPPLLVSFTGDEGAIAVAKAQDEDFTWFAPIGAPDGQIEDAFAQWPGRKPP